MIRAFFAQRSQIFLIIAGITWCAFVTSGFMLLGREEFTPAAVTHQGTTFPANSALLLSQDKPTLLLFVHPLCPCSRASLHELDSLLAQTRNKVTTTVIFTIPKGLPPGWEQGDLWKSATTDPDVEVFRDQGGQEARRFGVVGSGHALLYAPSGALLFSGGITESRGHEGDNLGRDAVCSFILSGHALVSHTPVFGCSLL